MIRAMVVDDEKLVRKGFISVIDWASFGIVIVGEAADGKSAMEFLASNEVDLLFTDITMPGMNGFELLKLVRHRFPRMKSVVLTCHHEFDFLQEALRLGAIDYIVKTLLDMENVDDVMNRIVERIQWEENSRAAYAPPLESDQERVSVASALLLCPVIPGEDSTELFRMPIAQRNPLMDLGGIWMAPLSRSLPPAELNRELVSLHAGKWQAALVTGLQGHPFAEVKRTLSERLARQLFYESEPAAARLSTIPYETLRREQPASASEIETDFANWTSLKWALYSSDWEAFVQKVQLCGPDPERLAAFAESLGKNWNGLLLDEETNKRLYADLNRNRTWKQWKDWFRSFSDNAQRRMLELSLSREVLLSLIHAVQYMRLHAGDKMNQSDVALHINMSRSYFSQCFARFAGQSFGEMLRHLRIERAKTLLLESDAPVYEIASLAGFEDDKYFSRVFKERVGKLPTEYRMSGMKTV
ncbi:response regulator [Paenibacillus solisilvae]|uniref:Response regulator n=1 Tax=Paenibacillus solisilvae TaxID=2486751 RepID=A0ABW0VUR2_9BACL